MTTPDAAEQEQMRAELGSLLRRAIATGDWRPYQEALDGWIATAGLGEETEASVYKTHGSSEEQESPIKKS